jgi:hypothetical protein
MDIYLGTLGKLAVVVIEPEDSRAGKYYLRFEEEKGAAVTFRLDFSDFARLVGPAFEKHSERVKMLERQLESERILSEQLRQLLSSRQTEV